MVSQTGSTSSPFQSTIMSAASIRLSSSSQDLEGKPPVGGSALSLPTSARAGKNPAQMLKPESPASHRIHPNGIHIAHKSTNVLPNAFQCSPAVVTGFNSSASMIGATSHINSSRKTAKSTTHEPLISRKIGDPTGFSMEWSKKIDVKNGEKMPSGIYCESTVNGETVYRSCAKLIFHVEKDSFVYGDQKSMFKFIEEQCRLKPKETMAKPQQSGRAQSHDHALDSSTTTSNTENENFKETAPGQDKRSPSTAVASSMSLPNVSPLGLAPVESQQKPVNHSNFHHSAVTGDSSKRVVSQYTRTPEIRMLSGQTLVGGIYNQKTENGTEVMSKCAQTIFTVDSDDDFEFGDVNSMFAYMNKKSKTIKQLASQTAKEASVKKETSSNIANELFKKTAPAQVEQSPSTLVASSALSLPEMSSLGLAPVKPQQNPVNHSNFRHSAVTGDSSKRVVSQYTRTPEIRMLSGQTLVGGIYNQKTENGTEVISKCAQAIFTVDSDDDFEFGDVNSMFAYMNKKSETIKQLASQTAKEASAKKETSSNIANELFKKTAPAQVGQSHSALVASSAFSLPEMSSLGLAPVKRPQQTNIHSKFRHSAVTGDSSKRGVSHYTRTPEFRKRAVAQTVKKESASKNASDTTDCFSISHEDFIKQLEAAHK